MELKEDCGESMETVNTSSTEEDGIDRDTLADDENDEVEEGNPRWADAIARVLSSTKPKHKKSLVLSRAKKLNDIKKEKKSYDFEIEGEIKEDKPTKEELNKVIIKKEPKPKVNLLLRVKPTIKDRDHEKTLKRVATRGVVQLFNAVRMQQKDLRKQLKEVGPLDHKKDAVLNNINKKKFLDVLMGGERAKSEMIGNTIKNEEIKAESDDGDHDDDVDENESRKNGSGKSQWSVLRDDFMTNKKLKHWDKEDSNSDNNSDKSS